MIQPQDQEGSVLNEQAAIQDEIETLRARLNEALEALEAIRSGSIDALVIYGPEGEQIYTLQGAEQPYRIMVENINEGAATLSEDGLVLYANTCLAKLLGAPLENLLGAPLSGWVSASDIPIFQAILEHGRRESARVEIHMRARDNGSAVPVLLSLSPVNLPAGEHICAIVTDLTEQKRSIEIQEAERTARLIIEQAAEAIVVCDASGKITRASRAAHTLAGQNPLLKPFETVFPLQENLPDGCERCFSLRAVLDGETFQRVEARLNTTTHGQIQAHELQVSATPLVIPGARKMGCVITMTDVTERKLAEEEIRSYAQKLERSNQDLKDFAYFASHDLQEPLRKIKSFGQLLVLSQGERLDDEGRDYLLRMENAATRMMKMIEDLLTYSRVANRNQNYIWTDLNQIAREVVSDLEMSIQKTGGQVKLGHLPLINADRTQIRRLLQNLISNSLKFHRPDVAPVILVEAHLSTPDLVEISVSDNGIGFDMQYAEQIFQPFQRLHGRSEFEGSGMGLTICQKIAERHQGSIRAHSIPGEGSVFLVTLPVKGVAPVDSNLPDT